MRNCGATKTKTTEEGVLLILLLYVITHMTEDRYDMKQLSCNMLRYAKHYEVICGST